MNSTARLRFFRISGAVALLLLPAWVSAAAHESQTLQLTQPEDSEFIVLGYLWGDGVHTEKDPRGTWHLGERSRPMLDRFAAAAQAIGCEVTRRNTANSKGKFGVTITGLKFEVPREEMPPMLIKANERQTKAFLAAVIEGEGSKEGLVLDDPSKKHIDIMAELLKRVGIRTRAEGKNFWRLYAETEDWPHFQTFPFVQWGRVPGGKAK